MKFGKSLSGGVYEVNKKLKWEWDMKLSNGWNLN